jgi:hypothetical protein
MFQYIVVSTYARAYGCGISCRVLQVVYKLGTMFYNQCCLRTDNPMKDMATQKIDNSKGLNMLSSLSKLRPVHVAVRCNTANHDTQIT